MIFDTHAHYYDGAFDPDRDELLAALPSMGVALVVCPGCDLESSRASVALAEKFGYLYAAVGFHPENLEGASLDQLDQVRTMSAHPKVKAIGEIGLDYYWVKTPDGIFLTPSSPSRRSWTCLPSSMTGTHTGTVWTSCGPIPAAGGCSTAIRAASRMRRYCWIGAGCSPLPGTSPLPMPGVAPR